MPVGWRTPDRTRELEDEVARLTKERDEAESARAAAVANKKKLVDERDKLKQQLENRQLFSLDWDEDGEWLIDSDIEKKWYIEDVYNAVVAERDRLQGKLDEARQEPASRVILDLRDENDRLTEERDRFEELAGEKIVHDINVMAANNALLEKRLDSVQLKLDKKDVENRELEAKRNHLQEQLAAARQDITNAREEPATRVILDLRNVNWRRITVASPTAMPPSSTRTGTSGHSTRSTT
jgi:chromosome segregation ATPase